MFHQLTSYFLNGVSDRESVSGIEEQNVRLTSAEDDWVLVDRDSEGDTEVSSSLDSIPDCDEPTELPCATYSLQSLLTRSSSAASLPCTNIEESWFLTPPPCFTSAGPVHMETSPLENLLIEHPSMSVYQHTGRRHSSAQSPPAEEFVRIEVVPYHVPAPAINVQQQVVPRRQHQVETLRQQQQRQMDIVKLEQKLRKEKMCQALKRDLLERNNKAREVNNRNHRQRRGERSQGAVRSNANNNRKC